jgi:hypothetical protein
MTQATSPLGGTGDKLAARVRTDVAGTPVLSFGTESHQGMRPKSPAGWRPKPSGCRTHPGRVTQRGAGAARRSRRGTCRARPHHFRHGCAALHVCRDAPLSIPHVPRAVGGGMRETAKVLNGLLFAVTPWLVLVAMALFLFPGPVQRWGLASLERFERWRAESGVRRAAPLLTQMLLVPPRIQDRVGGHGLGPGYVVRW